MPLFYLDASALLKRYKTEKGTNVVEELFSGRQQADVFVTSHFTTVEIESVAARALKARLLNKRTHGALLRQFAEDLGEHIIVLPVSTALVNEAASAARRNAVRAGDAIHMATSLRVKEAHPGNVVFVSSDKELVKACEAEGFIVLDPENEDALSLLRELRKA